MSWGVTRCVTLAKYYEGDQTKKDEVGGGGGGKAFHPARENKNAYKFVIEKFRGKVPFWNPRGTGVTVFRGAPKGWSETTTNNAATTTLQR
jgi:hypothetical protein